MKTPDEIKKALKCSVRFRTANCTVECKKCELHITGYTMMDLSVDALAYIQQLEQELAAVKRERDAAVFALHGNCDECCWKDTAKCASCIYGIDAWNTHDDCWEWDGVCPENTEVREDG